MFLKRGIDFHLHSFYSDGLMSIKQVLLESFFLNYSSVAITDHFDQLAERDKVEEYVNELILAKKAVRDSEINFFASIEVPYQVFKEFKGKFDFLEKKLDFFLVEDVEDFLSLYDVTSFALTTDALIGLAHITTHLFDDKTKLAEFVGNSRLFVELNQGYFNRKYAEENVKKEQLKVFSKIAEDYSNLFSVGTDSHGVSKLETVNTLEMLGFLDSQNALKRLVLLDKIVEKDDKNTAVFSSNTISKPESFDEIENAFSKEFKQFAKEYISMAEKTAWAVTKLFLNYPDVPDHIKREIKNMDTNSEAWNQFMLRQLSLKYCVKDEETNEKLLNNAIKIIKNDAQNPLGWSVNAALVLEAVGENFPNFKNEATTHINKLKEKEDYSLQKNLKRLLGKSR